MRSITEERIMTEIGPKEADEDAGYALGWSDGYDHAKSEFRAMTETPKAEPTFAEIKEDIKTGTPLYGMPLDGGPPRPQAYHPPPDWAKPQIDMEAFAAHQRGVAGPPFPSPSGSTHGFAGAIDALIRGQKVARRGSNVFMELHTPNPEDPFDRAAIILTAKSGATQWGWTPTMDDLLARDWGVVE